MICRQYYIFCMKLNHASKLINNGTFFIHSISQVPKSNNIKTIKIMISFVVNFCLHLLFISIKYNCIIFCIIQFVSHIFIINDQLFFASIQRALVAFDNHIQAARNRKLKRCLLKHDHHALHIELRRDDHMNLQQSDRTYFQNRMN